MFQDTTHRDYCVRVPESPQPVSEQNITLIFDGTFVSLNLDSFVQ